VQSKNAKQNSKAAKQQSSKAAKQQSSKAAKQQSSKAAKQHNNNYRQQAATTKQRPRDSNIKIMVVRDLFFLREINGNPRKSTEIVENQRKSTKRCQIYFSQKSLSIARG
jgi:hypothetical protein